MREIKFRGIELESKNWVYGSLINFDPIPEIQENDYDEGAYGYQRWEVIPESVGQFYMELQTYDNEVQSFDAYEGDIIEVGRYAPTEYYTVVIEDIRKTPDNLFGSSVVSRKLLGNIYENPELLNA
ncbi:YopX family protein [Chryseobacterium sp. JK1]|uniref:YopX family protein n=1 Tax=Chryseobacterium sp. JK1 TaxID=874294 RepID=UPI003D68E6CF